MDADLRGRLGTVGVWLAPPMLATMPVDDQRRLLARLEDLGYGSVWTGELPHGGRDVFAQLGVWLAATRRIIVGSGIANITRHDGGAMLSSATTLAEAYPGRLILGLGGHRTRDQLRGYLDALTTDVPGPYVPRVLAALGPRVLELAAERTDGAHPFHMPVANTERARRILGPGKLLIPEQPFLLGGAERARETFRAPFRQARAESAYDRNLRRLGYTDADLAGGRSDRLVDAMLAHGDPGVIAARVRDHLAAGADHVLVSAGTFDADAAVAQLAEAAPALAALG